MSPRLPLLPCDYRWPMPQAGVYYCRHPQVHAEGQLVHARVCDGCPLQGTQTAAPRSPPSFYPTLCQRVLNFLRASWQHFQNGRTIASPAEQLHRRTICAGCGYFDSRKQSCVHLGCGCQMRTKWRWQSSHCPFNPPKW